MGLKEIKWRQELKHWPSAINDGTVWKSGKFQRELSLLRPGPAHRHEDQLHDERPRTEGVNCSSLLSAYHPPLSLSFCSDLGFFLKINLPDKVSDESSQEGPWLLSSHIQLSHFAVAGREGGLPGLNLIFSPIFWEAHNLHRESE